MPPMSSLLLAAAICNLARWSIYPSNVCPDRQHAQHSVVVGCMTSQVWQPCPGPSAAMSPGLEVGGPVLLHRSSMAW